MKTHSLLITVAACTACALAVGFSASAQAAAPVIAAVAGGGSILVSVNDLVATEGDIGTNLSAETPGSEATMYISDNNLGVRFASPQYSTWETGVVVTVTVLRGDDLGLPFTVEYLTSDLTARAGDDYLAGHGTLRFGPGQLDATITGPLETIAVLTALDDGVIEHHEAPPPTGQAFYRVRID